MTTLTSDHADRIREQFTKQADPFAAFRIHSQEISLEWLREELHLSGEDRVLDAGCGPGLVACHLAPHVGTMVGVDATPAMVAKARQIAAERGCVNASFQEGIMERLPFPDAVFDGVVTRYTFHHLLDADLALAELVRVCRPGGRVVVCDAAPNPGARAAYDEWERIRDPSHTSAHTAQELMDAATRCMTDVTLRSFRLDAGFDLLVASSFPNPGGADLLRERLRADIGINALDLDARLVEGRLHLSFPIALVSGTVPNQDAST